MLVFKRSDPFYTSSQTERVSVLPARTIVLLFTNCTHKFFESLFARFLPVTKVREVICEVHNKKWLSQAREITKYFKQTSAYVLQAITKNWHHFQAAPFRKHTLALYISSSSWLTLCFSSKNTICVASVLLKQTIEFADTMHTPWLFGTGWIRSSYSAETAFEKHSLLSEWAVDDN